MICEKHKDLHIYLTPAGVKSCWDCFDETQVSKLAADIADDMHYGTPASSANDRQVGGGHYAAEIQHWDFAASQNFDYFQGQITKYVTRWKKKGGLQDLEKARHFLDKYIELNTPKEK